ncbi:hypothetical protein VTO42DRAFT_3247 [Malbranchea cinnamomea]
MVYVEPFAVEQWMEAYETEAKFNIAETCCASISIDDLRTLSDDKTSNPVSTSTKLTYGAIRGSHKLRSNLAGLYPLSKGDSATLSPKNVLVAPGAIHANFLSLYTLVSPGDHVVCHYPTYQQLYSVPKSLGAEVSLWKSRKEDGWKLHIEELRALLKPNTKLIILNNPQNPTGAIVPESVLREVIEIARERSIFVLSDEVYRPLFHSVGPEELPPSILTFGYERTVATGSMSKAYALAGIRVGWIASCSKELIEACQSARDYTTISVSQVDDQIASFALDRQCVGRLLDRNLTLAKRNLAILEQFVEEHREFCDWVRPKASTTAFVRFSRGGKAVDDVAFCKLVLEKAGVFFVPGSRCFGEEFKGFVRIGYVCETEVLQDGLAVLRVFMERDYPHVPLVDSTC